MSALGFLHEKQTKRYMEFLFVCCLFLCGFLTGGVGLHMNFEKYTLVERELSIASGLLEAGIPAETIADAFRNEVVTEEGEQFLAKIGHSGQTSAFFLPSAEKTILPFGVYFLVAGILFVTAVLGGSAFYLKKRELFYQNVSEIVTEYSEGRFERHLPGKKEGAFYQLCGAVEQLALALQAKGETERSLKEFWKDMISNISHQLKTPLAALNMYMEIVSEEFDDPEVVKKFSGKAIQSLERMEQLIQSLLKVMRLDAG